MTLSGLLLMCSTARASDVTALDYAVAISATSCPDAASFRDAVAAHLGYDPFGPDGASSVRVRILRTGRSFEGRIELRDGARTLLGTKLLEAERCEDLISTMSFAVGMALDPASVMHPKPTRVPPEPLPVAAEAPAPPAGDVRLSASVEPRAGAVDPPRPPIAETKTRIVPRVFAGAGVATLGPVAGTTASVLGGAGVGYGKALVEVEGRYLTPSSESAGGGQVTTSMYGVALLPCVQLAPLFLCADVLFGELQGSGGTADGQRATTFFSQTGARLGATIKTPWFDVEPVLDGLVTLTNTEATFRTGGVWSTRPFGLSLGARVAKNLL